MAQPVRQTGGQLAALLFQRLACVLMQLLRRLGSLAELLLRQGLGQLCCLFSLLLSLDLGLGDYALGLLQALRSAAVQSLFCLGQLLLGLTLLLEAVVDALLSLLSEAYHRLVQQLVEQEHQYKEAQDSEQQLGNIDGQHVRFSFQSRTAVKSWR